jgi:hypothetical protein
MSRNVREPIDWAALRRTLGALTLVSICALGCAHGATAAPVLGRAPTTCFWSDVVDPPHKNMVLPDANATYWYSRFTLPAGGRVVLRGTFPHARSFFLWNYQLITPHDGLHDAQITPARGSANPFPPGAERRTRRRGFTLTISGQPPPAPARRAPNTVYAGTPGTAQHAQDVQLIYRVYLPDAGRDRTAGAGLPAARYVPAGGPAHAGQAACDILHNDGAQAPNLGALLAPDYPAHLALSADPTHPALDPVRWYAFFNLPRLWEPFEQGTPSQGLIAALPTEKAALAVAPDADSGIAYSYVDRSLGPDPNGHNVLVLRGKLPTTPRTFHGHRRARGATQLRYWSICQDDSFVVGRVGDCLYDEQVPVDRRRRYRIVVSLPQDRPANATVACGVAWLDYGTLGDGLLKPRAGLLLLRNQLADPSFRQTIADVDNPGTERQVMGDYLPSGAYESRAQFERGSCNRQPRR